MNDNYFHGDYVMRGHGLGSLFSSLFRRAIPLLKLGGKYMGKKAMETGMHVLDDVIEGHSLKKSLKSNLKRAGQGVLKDVRVKLKGGRARRRVKRGERAKSDHAKRVSLKRARSDDSDSDDFSCAKRIKMESGDQSLY